MNESDDAGAELGRARECALRLLARREHSAAELKARLGRRGMSPEAAAEVIDGLRQAGWQSDTRYAELLARSRVRQGYGPIRVQAELRAANVEPQTISAVIEAADVNWQELLQQVWARRFGRLPASAKEAARQARYLAGRGFEPAAIRQLLRNGGGE